MTDHRWTAIVTIVALLVYVRLIFQVGSARGKSGIKAPEMTGDPMLVRGAQSDLLSSTTAQEMTQRGPKARLVELDGIGHAPTFVQPDQIALAREFLLGQPA